jgi:hypothetical protein
LLNQSYEKLSTLLLARMSNNSQCVADEDK